MLAILGLLSALAAAGVVLDSALTRTEDGNEGDDERGAVSSDTPDPEPMDQSLTGTEAGDLLAGDDGDDTLQGGGGDDRLAARGGDDALNGGEGEDWLWGDGGDDRLNGAAGDDALVGGDGADTLRGGDGNDNLAGHSGADSLAGDAGADTLVGGEGDDSADGGDGDDWVAGGIGNDALHGGEGIDTLDGNDGLDTLRGADDGWLDFLNGGSGDDLLVAGSQDRAHGGEGADLFAVQGPATISDYTAGEDSLVVLYDPAAHPDPQVAVAEGMVPGDAVILLDGRLLATVSGGAGLTAADIMLVPQDRLAA